MGGPDAPSVLVFDVNETLLDIESLAPLFERLFGDPATLRDWFAQLILHAEALTLSGIYAPFPTLAAGVLRMVGEIRGVRIGEADTDELRRRTLAMPAHPDVPPALARLKAAGFRLLTLTNSAPDAEANPLALTGIDRWVERQFSVHPVRRFKPHPDGYRQIEEALGLPPAALCMVASHMWDTIGAQSLGWSGALLTRPGNAALPVPNLPRPDLVAPDLDRLATEMIRRWKPVALSPAGGP